MRYEDLKAESTPALITRATSYLPRIADTRQRERVSTVLEAQSSDTSSSSAQEAWLRASLCDFLLAMHEGRAGDCSRLFLRR